LVQAIVAAAHGAQIAMRSGQMYAMRLLQRMGIEPSPGVARVSLAHYNTREEVDRLIDALRRVLPAK
jgi:selenocysteine lyase/cysteine desulfurase